MDESNPMAALLAQHNGTHTLLDKRLERNPAPAKNEPQQSSEEDDAPIGLSYRQPSFSSLCRELVGKDGKVVSDLAEIEEDPVIVLDDKSEKSDAAIGLTYRQPSFSSFDTGTVKGGEMLRDIKPVRTIPIEDVPEIPEEMESTDDNSPDAAMMKELRQRNMDRWKQMGYEPPTNPVPVEQPKPAVEPPKKRKIGTLEEIKEEDEERDEKIKPRHRRAGSNGMKLGEASTSLARMQEALMLGSPEKSTTVHNEFIGEFEEDLGSSEGSDSEARRRMAEGDDDEEAAPLEEEEEEEAFVVEEEAVAEVMGNLAALLKGDNKSPTYMVLSTGDAKCVKPGEVAQVRKKLTEFKSVCIENLWVDEMAYLTTIMNELGSGAPSPRCHDDEVSAVDAARARAKASAEKYDRLIEKEKMKRDLEIQMLNDEFREAAAALDAEFRSQDILQKYNKPSPELIEMKEQCKTLLRLEKISEARRMSSRVQARERKETKDANTKLRQKYEEANRRLKEDFAVRRDLLERKYTHHLQRLERDQSRSQEKHAKRIAALASSPAGNRPAPSAAPASDVTLLAVRLPRAIRRKTDIKDIEWMAGEIARGCPVHEIQDTQRPNQN